MLRVERIRAFQKVFSNVNFLTLLYRSTTALQPAFVSSFVNSSLIAGGKGWERGSTDANSGHRCIKYVSANTDNNTTVQTCALQVYLGIKWYQMARETSAWCAVNEQWIIENCNLHSVSTWLNIFDKPEQVVDYAGLWVVLLFNILNSNQ